MAIVDPYLIDSVPLENLAVGLSTAEGLQVAPEWRSRDFEIPGAHGVFDPGLDPTGQRRPFGAGQITFSGWVKGVDPGTGLFTGGSLATYFTRVDALMSMFHKRSLVIDHVRPDGTRRAVARLGAALAPDRTPASPWFGRWEAMCVIPGAFWSEAATVTGSGTVVSGGSISLGVFAPSTAPIADGVVTFGPCSNPTLIQGGTYIAYDGVIAAGRQLTVDCSDWSLGAGSGTAWTPSPAALRYGPGPSLFELDTTAGLSVTLTHTGGGSAFAAFAARRRYLTS